MEDLSEKGDTFTQDSVDSCHTNEEAIEKGEMNVVVKTLPRSQKVIDQGDCYPMKASPRGLALIIEIEEYINEVQRKRVGSHVDVQNLTALFQQLHFKAEHKKNLGRKDFLGELERFASDAQHTNADMMILVVLSHGRDGQI